MIEMEPTVGQTRLLVRRILLIELARRRKLIYVVLLGWEDLSHCSTIEVFTSGSALQQLFAQRNDLQSIRIPTIQIPPQSTKLSNSLSLIQSRLFNLMSLNNTNPTSLRPTQIRTR